MPRRLDAAKALEVANVKRSLDAIPSLTYLTGKHAAGTLRGTGEIVIGGEVNRLLPRATAKNVHPLMTKTTMYLRFPVQFLGTPLVEFWKGSGSKTSLSCFRDISLADTDGKNLGAHQRLSLFAAVRVIAGKSQIGSGLNGGTTDVCNLHVSQTFCLARSRRQAVGSSVWVNRSKQQL